MPRDNAPDEKQPANERPLAQNRTPSADMQPEDAGTAASGSDAKSTPTQPAMKQTSKGAGECGAP